LNRGGLRAALIASVLVALVALGFVLGRTIVHRNADQQDAAGTALQPQVSQRIREFRRVKVKDGRKVWELTASEAQYLEDDGQVVVKNPQVLFFVDDGGNVQVTGHEGRIFVKGNNLDRIELGGGIEVKMRDYLVHTDQAFYDHEHDTIVSPGRVQISANTLSLDGETMVVELKDQRLQVLKDVTTTFYRAADGSSGPTLDFGPHPSGSRAGEAAGAAKP